MPGVISITSDTENPEVVMHKSVRLIERLTDLCSASGRFSQVVFITPHATSRIISFLLPIVFGAWLHSCSLHPFLAFASRKDSESVVFFFTEACTRRFYGSEKGLAVLQERQMPREAEGSSRFVPFISPHLYAGLFTAWPTFLILTF